MRNIKNKVVQKHGICKDHLLWMNTQAEKEHISVAGRHGYIMFDEMSIQVHTLETVITQSIY